MQKLESNYFNSLNKAIDDMLATEDSGLNFVHLYLDLLVTADLSMLASLQIQTLHLNLVLLSL